MMPVSPAEGGTFDRPAETDSRADFMYSRATATGAMVKHRPGPRKREGGGIQTTTAWPALLRSPAVSGKSRRSRGRRLCRLPCGAECLSMETAYERSKYERARVLRRPPMRLFLGPSRPQTDRPSRGGRHVESGVKAPSGRLFHGRFWRLARLSA